MLSKLETLSGYEPKEDAIIQKLLEAARDLVQQNWQIIKTIRDNSESEVKVSLAFDVDCRGPRPHVVSSISFSQKFKDEREDYVEDPDQGTLPLDVNQAKPIDAEYIMLPGNEMKQLPEYTEEAS